MDMQDTTPRVAALLKRRLSPALVPATFFGMVLGLGGLGNGWRVAGRIWGAPVVIGEILALTAAAVWFLWFALYALKWARRREAALAELRRPVRAPGCANNLSRPRPGPTRSASRPCRWRRCASSSEAKPSRSRP